MYSKEDREAEVLFRDDIEESLSRINAQSKEIFNFIKNVICERIGSAVNEIVRKVDDAKDLIIKHYNHINDIVEQILNKVGEIYNIVGDTLHYSKSIYDSFGELVDIIKQLLEKLKTSNDINIIELNDKIKELEAENKELVASICSLANGAYNSPGIEFFALKTYRGWRYICHNGNALQDIENAKGVFISWREGDYIDVEVRT